VSGPDFDARLKREAAAVHERLRAHLAALVGVAPRLDEAVAYSLLAGGKRLRPILCLWVHDAEGGARGESVWRCALALEMLHTYSLIHDDLPAMDDDDLRRGQPSCHRRFDEATAILAGDALQTEAFELLGAIEPAELAAICVLRLARAAGRRGMAAGQQWDLEGVGPTPDRPGLERIHRLKTGALLGAAVSLGAACAGRRGADLERAEAAGVELGIAFQMVDDVLDETAPAEVLGKSPGKDAVQGKVTATRVFGAEAALAEAEDRRAGAESTLRQMGLWSRDVARLCEILVHRDR
jgi:geranylgeranyl pyrophosphate synthase